MLSDEQQIRSPPSATLLREPLLRGSANTVTVRVGVTSSSTSSSLLRRRSKENAGVSESPKSASGFLASLNELPREVWVVLLIDFLNSYRSFGFRAVQYQYLTNEFALTDVEAGSYLGMQAWLLVIFGMVGAMMVDACEAALELDLLPHTNVDARVRFLLPFCDLSVLFVGRPVAGGGDGAFSPNRLVSGGGQASGL